MLPRALFPSTPAHRPGAFARPAFACLLGILVGCAVSPAGAGRPLVTDEASILEAGACQVELFTERSRDAWTNWAVPACNPFGGLELGLGGGRGREEGGERSRFTAWQLKTVLQEFDEAQPGFGLALSSRRDGMVHRGRLGDTELKGLATVPVRGEALLGHLNLGWARERDDSAGSRRNRLNWAAALDAEILPRSRASLETYGSGSGRPWGQLGLRHELVPGHLQLDTSVGAQHGRSRESRYYTLGLVLVTPSFLR